MKDSQLGQFVTFFHQDFGDSPDESLQDNIVGFFCSLYYDDGEDFIRQVNQFIKVALSTSGRGSLWRELGGSMWIKELENPAVWEALKTLAIEFPDYKSVTAKSDEFEDRVYQLIP